MNESSCSGGDDSQLGLAAGSVLDNVALCNTQINDDSAFSGMLTADCWYRDLKIADNVFLLRNKKSIGINGVLSGGAFCNNKLAQLGEDQLLINLYPARVGRNVAEDGLLYILSFKADGAYQYGEFSVMDNYLHANDQPADVCVADLRGMIPATFSHCAAGLANFDYQTFHRQFVGWTVRDFQARDAAGYTRLYDWLERREDEYRSGIRTDEALSPPTHQQRALGTGTLIDKLAQARIAMSRNQADFRELRLVELPHAPLRSFIMKRLALRNADLVLLSDLRERNAYRQACLQFLLPTKAFRHLTKNKHELSEYTPEVFAA